MPKALSFEPPTLICRIISINHEIPRNVQVKNQTVQIVSSSKYPALLSFSEERHI